MKQGSLFDDAPAGEGPTEAPPPDQDARDFAVDPSNDVVLEASAGTGKTRVLVDRYVTLIARGVDPRNILAVTFTRKAAAEMRDRILAALRERSATDTRIASRWRELRERIADIQISTIDAFCFALLREFPLEAGVDPGFEIADETEMARFAREAMDLTLRASRGLMARNENVRLLFARAKLGPLRDAIQSLLDRRHVARRAVERFVAQRAPRERAADVCAAFLDRLRALLAASPHRAALIDEGPSASPEFRWLHQDLRDLGAFPADHSGRVQQLQRRLARYFLTQAGKPRAKTATKFSKTQFASADAKRRHDQAIRELAPAISHELDALDRDIQGLLARGLRAVLAIAIDTYEQLLDDHAVLDFAGMLAKSVELLGRQEEFARSRLKLQSRFHHVLVDEFQDTNRLQWQLVSLLIDAWGEGEGAQDAPTSIFVVGDRKQSIYRFRHAEVTLLDEVAGKVEALRGRSVRRALTHSFRAVPELLAFVNALSAEVAGAGDVDECFRYGETDRFVVPPVAGGGRRDGEPVLGLIAESSMEACGHAVAGEIVRLLNGATVRDRTGTRPARPDDIAILFRARTGHQYFESALEARNVRTYVYKGLGFFDAAEVQDVQALLRYLAQPDNDLRAAELLRSRFVRVSDAGLARLAPRLADALRRVDVDAAGLGLEPLDRALLDRAREAVAGWLPLVDVVTPSELLERVLRDSAYAFEIRGRRAGQARENIKKMRGLVRRIENRGYATIGRIAGYFETLRAGDESHAVIEAAGCVNLMTIHAAKGLEYPFVFVVNMHVQGRGRSSLFSVIERGPDGEPEVAFGSTDGTRLEDLREKEELRRLLYVATTRARDRLYLAAEVDPETHKLRRGARSLAGLLPATLGDLFGVAGESAGGEVEWASPEGTFAFRVCHADAASAPGPEDAAAPPPIEADVATIAAAGPSIVTATGLPVEAGFKTVAPAVDVEDSDTDRLTGTIVHRLFQRGLRAEATETEVAEMVPRLMRAEEFVDVADVKRLSRAAAAMYLRLRRRADVEELFAGAETYYEVPFSFQPGEVPGTVVRGRIDCVVVRVDGSLLVIEFKTGAPRAAHEAQAAVYRDAVRALAPGRDVQSVVLYA